MANVITHSLSYTKEMAREFFYQPMTIGDENFSRLCKVFTDVRGSRELNQISKLDKITKVYQQGDSFTGSTGVTVTQKTLTVGRLKAQVQQNGRALYDSVMEEIANSGVDSDNIEGTLLEQIVLSLFIPGLKRDRNRQAWLGNTVKETRSSGVPTGTADTDYNVYNGWWTLIINDVDATTIPAAQFVDMNSTTYLDTAAVKEVDTVTLTGTSGTANVNINGTNYLATFTTNLTTSAANFVTSHAATILAREGKVVVTSSGADIIITAGIAGMAQQDPTVANVSGDLAGSNANTTANTPTGSIKTNGARDLFRAMWDASTSELKGKKGVGLYFAVTQSVYDNYLETLEGTGTVTADSIQFAGLDTLTWRGIPIIPFIEWDTHISNDFSDARPHRALLTIQDNLAWGTDADSDIDNIEAWYEKKTQENYFRVEYMAGTQYVDEEYITVAYA